MKETLKRKILENFVFYVNHEARVRTRLLSFQNGRNRCRKRLWEASGKCEAVILNYHISHDKLQVVARGSSTQITNLMHDVATSTAADHFRTHDIEGPFWRKRFKATLVQNGIHLLRCYLIMDMTMVSEEKCLSPGEWPLSGYCEITGGRMRYRIIDREMSATLAGFDDYPSMRKWYIEHINSSPGIMTFNHENLTAALAVGGLKEIEFIARMYPKKLIRIELLAHDTFGETYGLFVSNKEKQRFTRALK